MQTVIRAYAKINLMLDICGKFENGYHSLFMIMQSVGLYDTVTVRLTDSGRIELTCSEPEIPCNESNTAYKAAQVFFEASGMVNPGVAISIEKRIPHEAGLAGGSADAAAVLTGLNNLYGGRLTGAQLIAAGLRVGSDVPFCLVGGTCVVQDTGGVVSVLPALTDCFFVLCKPDCGVSTKEAYSDYDKAQGIRHLDRAAMLHAAATADTEKMFSLCDNVFEQVIDIPSRVVIKAQMRRNNALACCMSGSGPTVFGAFAELSQAEACAEALSREFAQTYVCGPVEGGCVPEE